MTTIPITTGLLFDGPRAVPKKLALEDVARQEEWLASQPGRDAVELWFRSAWAAYHDEVTRAPKIRSYPALLKVCVVLLVAIRVRVEARASDMGPKWSDGCPDCGLTKDVQSRGDALYCSACDREWVRGEA